jgi:hypothetical protein
VRAARTAGLRVVVDTSGSTLGAVPPPGRYLVADANALGPEDRLTWALRCRVTAVQHQGTLFSRVDDRIPVRVAAADPNITLSSRQNRDEDPE